MLNHKNFALVIDHVLELNGQKKLAVGSDGKWYVWSLFDVDNKPQVQSFKSEAEAKKYYAAIEVVKTNVIYTSTPVPFIVNLSDSHWGEYDARKVQDEARRMK
jgi:hypothetical protein